MTAAEYLNQIADLDECIKQDQRRREDKMLMATAGKGIDYSADRVQTSPSGDTLCKQVCDICDIDEKIKKEINVFIDAKELIIGQIRGLHNVRYNQVLYGIYVELKSLNQLALELCRSERTIQVWRTEALNEFGRIYKSEMKYFY